MSRLPRARKTPEKTHRAKLFRTGGSQAVRLPKECRLPGTEVIVRKVGNSVVLSPVETEYDAEFRSLVLGPPRTLIKRGPQGRIERKDFFR